MPIAVVDGDSSELSRNIIQGLNASEALRVAARSSTLAEAQQALARREVFAILDIPAGTERDVLSGRQARLPAYVDSVYFLLYNRTLQGILEATGIVTAELLSRDARSDGSLYRAALAKSSPVEVLNQPLFNPTGGYGSYVVPAAFVLILQQTLLLGTATMGGVALEQGGAAARRRRGAATAIIGQGIAHLLLALPGAALFLVVLPRLYGFSATAHFGDLLAMVVPFILSVSFLGQFVGSWFQRRETAILLFIALSLPLFFLVGVAWPAEAIPPLVRAASFIFPSTSAIDGLVRINQMDATLGDVFRDWTVLWGLALLYGLLAILSARVFMSEGGARWTRGLGNVCSRRWPRSRWLQSPVSSCCCRDMPLSRRFPAWSGRPRSASPPRFQDALCPSRFASARRSTKATSWPCSTIPSWPPLSAKRKRQPSARGPSGTGSIPASAPRRSPSWPTACERPRPTCCWPSSRTPAPSRWRRRDFASRQELDESKASLAKAQADLDLKRAQHAAASAGPIAEERALADARVALAEATVADLQAKLDKTRLVAPVDGTVGILVGRTGRGRSGRQARADDRRECGPVVRLHACARTT